MPRIVIDEFLGGLSPSRYIGNPTIQSDPGDPSNPTSRGWDAFIEGDVGLLRRGYQEGSITNISLATNFRMQWAKTFNRSSQGANDPGQYLFGLGDDSTLQKIYRIETAADKLTNSSLFPHTIGTASPVDRGMGMEYYNGYLYYASSRYLGRYDMSLTFNDSFNIFLGTRALGDPIDHPMVAGNGKLYIGNSNFSLNTTSIATVSGSTVNLQALDLSNTEQVVKALEFNRNFVFIATTNNTQGNNLTADSFLYVWDGISSSWQDQYKFPEEDFAGLRFNGGRLHAWGRRGMYVFNGNGFDLIYPYTGPLTPHGISIHPNGTLYYRDAVSAGVIYAYGSPNPQISPVVYRPYVVESGAVLNGAIQWINRTKLYAAASAGNRIRSFDGGGTGDYASAEWRTPMISTGGITRLLMVYLSFRAWPASCSVDVKFAKDDGTSATTIGTISTQGGTSAKFYPNGLLGDNWQIILNHTQGVAGATPKFDKIVIEYEIEKE